MKADAEERPLCENCGYPVPLRAVQCFNPDNTLNTTRTLCRLCVSTRSTPATETIKQSMFFGGYYTLR